MLKRLKRDRPDLAERVVAGEMSAHAAAIEAGFRKKATAAEQVARLLPKLSDEEFDRLFADDRNRRSRKCGGGRTDSGALHT